LIESATNVEGAIASDRFMETRVDNRKVWSGANGP
jgi:hypothetical protein